MKPFLSVIIPAYNEAERFTLTLVDVDRYLSNTEFSSEVIIVNDGSTDKTAEIAENMANIMKNTRVIGWEKNKGKGVAVRHGMLEAKGNWRVFMDADNSTSISEIEKMLPLFKEGYEVVIGSRAVYGAKLKPRQVWYKHLIGKAGNLFIQLFAIKGIKDTQCGFKCFSDEAAEKIFLMCVTAR